MLKNIGACAAKSSISLAPYKIALALTVNLLPLTPSNSGQPHMIHIESETLLSLSYLSLSESEPQSVQTLTRSEFDSSQSLKIEFNFNSIRIHKQLVSATWKKKVTRN